ncbi:MAG: ABC transporter permease subunit [Oscillospiraceae bacterium]|jgi:putative aldouronate transport system permease protein|nr:ABC transporter permease subunit [Oscillospiraceae bacterium]
MSTELTAGAQTQISGKKKKIKKTSVTLPFLAMLTPGLVILLVNNYLPMLGTIMAFQQYRFQNNFIYSILNSQWVGLKNVEFLFRNSTLWENMRNTIAYNLAFIALGMVIPVAFAIALNELWRPRLAKFYQTMYFLPYFLSWVVVSYLVFALFQTNGAVNTMILKPLGIDVKWYNTRNAWPPILIILQSWKYTGYNAVIYLAALSGISTEYYEAAMIDGVSKRQQIWYITLPLLRPVIIMLSLLAVGRIFNSDFGLFYNVPMGRSALYPVTEVLDTFIYRAMRRANEFGMATASSLFQSVIGFITVVSANLAVRKIDPESALF